MCLFAITAVSLVDLFRQRPGWRRSYIPRYLDRHVRAWTVGSPVPNRQFTDQTPHQQYERGL